MICFNLINGYSTLTILYFLWWTVLILINNCCYYFLVIVTAIIISSLLGLSTSTILVFITPFHLCINQIFLILDIWRGQPLFKVDKKDTETISLFLMGTLNSACLICSSNLFLFNWNLLWCWGNCFLFVIWDFMSHW